MSPTWKYALYLAAGLALLLVLGNLDGGRHLDTWPWVLSALPFPVVLYRFVVELDLDTDGLEFRDAVLASEPVVRWGAVLFGLFEFAYSWVFYDAGFDTWPIFFTLPVTILVTWVAGLVAAAACSWYVIRPTGPLWPRPGSGGSFAPPPRLKKYRARGDEDPRAPLGIGG